jgi:hypothetical protein
MNHARFNPPCEDVAAAAGGRQGLIGQPAGKGDREI